MGRQTRKRYKELEPEQQRVFDVMAAQRKGVGDGHMGGPHDVWLLNAEMAERLFSLSRLFRYRLSVDRRYIELTILITGAFWRAQFEWFAHEPVARKAGVPEDVISAIKNGDRPQFTDKGDEITFDLCTTLHNEHQIPDQTFQDAVTIFGEKGVAELVNLAGYYTMVSMTLNSFDVQLPKGAERPFS